MVIEELQRGDTFRLKSPETSGAEFHYLGSDAENGVCRAEPTFYEMTVVFPHGTEVEKV